MEQNSTAMQCLSKVVKELLPNNIALCRDILHTPGRGAACELQVRYRKALCWPTQSFKANLKPVAQSFAGTC